MASRSEDRFEIAFFDVETTMPTRTYRDRTILEFGSILVCPRTLVELDNYSTLVRPADLAAINSLYRRNGITRGAVLDAPFFQDIADRVYDILHGRIWAGHNILTFDCARIWEAFAQIGRPAPQPKGTIDSLALLTQRFGRRAGDMKMDTLATYFRLGQQTHRSLDDVRLNLEVLKSCATVLLLESSLPDKLTENTVQNSVESSSPFAVSGSSNGTMEFLQPDEVSIPSVCASLVPSYRGSQRIKLLHKDVTLQLCCRLIKLRYGIKGNYFDQAGRPQLNIVCYASQSLCEVLVACDDSAKKLSMDSGSSSEWRPVVMRDERFHNCATVRLHIQTAVYGGIAMYATEIYQKEPSVAEQRLVFTKFDASELDTLFKPLTFIDAFFSLEPYDYQQKAGIRLVAKKLIRHSN